MTSKDQVKDRLYNNTDELIRILENLGCHHINPHYGYEEIRCALPDGVTINSVSIRHTVSFHVECKVGQPRPLIDP